MGGDLLARVGAVHLVLVAALAAVFGFAGLPTGGVILGGTAMGLAFTTLWGIVAELVRRQRALLLAILAWLKIFLYVALAAAVLSGEVRVDGAGFAAGVSCFLVATLVVTAARAAERSV